MARADPYGSRQVAAVFRPASGRWQQPVVLSELGQDAGKPQVALSRSGQGIAVWRCLCPATPTIEGASFSRKARAWLRLPSISPPGTSADFPAVSVDARGEALAAWVSSAAPPFVVQVASRSPGGTFGGRQTLGREFAVAAQPQLAVDDRGDAMVAWPQWIEPSVRDIAAAVRPADGSFGRPAIVSTNLAREPSVALDAQGNGVAIWTEEGDTVGAAGLDAAGPQLRDLRIPRRGKVGQLLFFSVSALDVWTSLGSTTLSFGDGQGVTGTEGAGMRLTHAYRRPGRYAVRVASVDDLGHRTIVRRTVSITR